MTTHFDYETNYVPQDHSASRRAVAAGWTVLGAIFLGLLAL